MADDTPPAAMRAGTAVAARAWLAAPAPRAALVMLALVAAITARLSANFVLNHFYADGAGVDSWFLARMLWRGDAALTMPAAAVFPPHSYLGTHLAFVLIAPALLSHLLPVGMVAWYAFLVGAIHALLAVAVAHIALSAYGLATRGGVALAALLGLGFAFGGVAMAELQLPHYELLIVGFGLLFLAALARGDRAMAWLWLALTLGVREDAGFHLFGVLLLAQLVCRRRDAWIFLLACLGYSLAAFAAIRIAFPGDVNFARVYAGTPAYAHLTWSALAERLELMWQLRTYLWLPPAVAIAWAAWQREPLILVGVAAAIPWALLHVTAVSGGAATLDLYYSFPVLLGLGWAFVAPAWRCRGALAGGARRRSLIGFAALVAAALVGWVGDRFVVYPLAMNLAVGQRTLDAAAIEAFRPRLDAARRELGTLRADYGVLGLLPDAFRPGDWLRADALAGADTVAWFDPGQQDSLAWGTWLSSRLANHYRVAGTGILLASNRRLEQVPALLPALVPANPVWSRMRPTALAEAMPDGLRVPRERPQGLIADGPHAWWRYGLYYAHGVAIPAGRYEAQYELRFSGARDPFVDLVRLEVGFAWGPTAASVTVRAAQLRVETVAGQQPARVSVAFAVDPANAARWLQLRAIHLGNADVTLRNITLARTD